MPRSNAPIGIDAAITKVKAKAKDFIKESTPAKLAAWGRTFVEPDKSVYITADKEKSLIDKWKSTSAIDDRFVMAASGSSGGAQADLKLQLKADWGTWKAGTSPFVYHIPIDTYEDPAEKKRLAEEKKKNEEALAKRNEEARLKKEQEEKDKKDKELRAKAQKKLETDRTQKMNTAFNGLKTKPKDRKAWETQWLKDNSAKFKIENYMK
ncbi:MAG: hypothetical protein IT168_08820 [Bryobacterales bacterium]|nr:hypothetical protein [Bryobacterales bacterium]